jgi:hypothetical protein
MIFFLWREDFYQETVKLQERIQLIYGNYFLKNTQVNNWLILGLKIHLTFVLEIDNCLRVISTVHIPMFS